MPLSQDLRKRIVQLREKNLTQQQISERLLVPQSSVSRILSKHRKTGSLEVGKPTGRPRQFTSEDDDFIAQKIKVQPDITLAELIQKVHEELGKKVSVTVIQCSIKRLNLTRKKRLSTTRQKTLRRPRPDAKTLP